MGEGANRNGYSARPERGLEAASGHEHSGGPEIFANIPPAGIEAA